ncbi:uncharacterized protein LOC135153898 [Lytechinus pictus]|uniref:uncharacterized protein LOC135153898 n=1 Tax=Lytechinus pictus TaxID=7653 RepID=UPI0030B9E86F
MVLVEDDSPIKDELFDNSVVTVEEDEVSSDDQFNDEEPVVREEAKLLDMTELERRRAQAFLYLCANRKIVVSRQDIIATVLDAYRSNLELEHHRLTVELKDEIAVDLDGVTKEMFQLFFSAFAEKYMTGHLEKVPNNDHRLHATDLYRTLGRIIAHAFVLCGYWPIAINKATLTASLTAAVSEDLVLSSFLGMLNERECHILQALLHGRGSEDDQLRCLGVLTRFDCRQRVTNLNARDILTTLASAVTIYRPFHAVLQIGQGLTSYNNLWNGVGEQHIVRLFQQALPDATKVEDVILPVFSEDEACRVMEERVVIFLKTWMASLRPDQFRDFFIFWTASDAILPNQVLRVDFNSTDGLGRRPAATTCSDTLSLSRLYFSQEDFDQDMQVIFSEHSKIMDAL